MTATALKLRCPLAACATAKLTVPTAGYTAGQMVKVQDTVFVIVETNATLADTVAAIYKAEKIVVPKSAPLALAVGDKVYFDAGEAKVNADVTGNTLCGRVTVAAASADTEVEIDLNGHLAA